VTPEFLDTVDRGVRLHVGHSGTDFRFSARVLFDPGYLPTIISTDVNVFNVDYPVMSLAHTMSKMLAPGVPLNDVVSMTTLAPATVVRRQNELGLLNPGRGADVTVLRVEEADVELSDGYETITAGRSLSAVGCVRGGEWIPVPPDGRSTPPAGRSARPDGRSAQAEGRSAASA
jgi:dihydroorotase